MTANFSGGTPRTRLRSDVIRSDPSEKDAAHLSRRTSTWFDLINLVMFASWSQPGDSITSWLPRFHSRFLPFIAILTDRSAPGGTTAKKNTGNKDLPRGSGSFVGDLVVSPLAKVSCAEHSNPDQAFMSHKAMAKTSGPEGGGGLGQAIGELVKAIGELVSLIWPWVKIQIVPPLTSQSPLK